MASSTARLTAVPGGAVGGGRRGSDGSPYSRAMVCAMKGDVDGLSELLSGKPPEVINEQDPQFGHTALMCAAMYGKDDAVAFLCDDLKADQSVQAYDGDTALIWAARSMHEGCVLALLRTATLDQVLLRGREGRTALDWARKKTYRNYLTLAAFIDAWIAETVARMRKEVVRELRDVMQACVPEFESEVLEFLIPR